VARSLINQLIICWAGAAIFPNNKTLLFPHFSFYFDAFFVNQPYFEIWDNLLITRKKV